MIIAVPTMALASYLNSVVNTLIADMNKKSNELLNVLDARSDI